jgi:hypothetical protein
MNIGLSLVVRPHKDHTYQRCTVQRWAVYILRLVCSIRGETNS